MKILKLLFGRFGIVTLAILMQMAVYILFFFMLSEYYWIVYVFSLVIGVIVFVRVINRDLNPAQKILWVSVIMLSPIVGATLYVMIGDSRWSARTKERMHASFLKQAPAVNSTSDIPEKYVGQANYLISKAGTRAYRGCSTEYFPTGEKYFAALKNDLIKAKRFIFMEYFIIQKGEMWNEIEKILEDKAKEGVEVHLMYDDIGCMGKVPVNFYKYLRGKGIDCFKFNGYTPFITNLHNNRDHRKIVVIDGEIAYTGGINLADEYINSAGNDFYWKDTGVRIYGNAVGELAEQFMQLFEFTRRAPMDFDRYVCREKIDAGEEGVVLPYGTGPFFYCRCPIAEEGFLNMINRADREIYIMTPYLVADYSINRALASAVSRGVKVKVAIPDVPDKKTIYLITKSNAYYLMQNGVEIYRYKGGFLHAKSIVADREAAIVGT
ncbi:MAG: PLDc N-terminal domain-containing protein, partial [Clostridia bacterium]|nr:PLDc N-terminal domain-containing protein [Clostridia bacterium]